MAFNCAHERYDNHHPCPHYPGNDNYSGGFRRADYHVRHIRRYHKSKVPATDPSKQQPELEQEQEPEQEPERTDAEQPEI